MYACSRACVLVCMLVSVFVSDCVCTCVRPSLCVRVRLSAFERVRMCLRVVCVCGYVRAFACGYVLCVCECLCVLVYVFLFVCVVAFC